MSDSASKKPAGEAGPWYRDGLRFSCQPDCGKCCVNHGTYAYVYLEGDDLERLAEHLGLSPAEFGERYTTFDEGWRILRMDDPRCPFLDGDGVRCTVYEARPTQCRTFPFWDEHLKSAAAWRRVADFCPGIDRGTLHPLPLVRELAGERDL